MPMSGSTLGSTLKGDILTKLQAAFPINAGLQPSEKTAIMSAQSVLADAIGTPTGADVVTHVVANALQTGLVTTGSGSGGATTGTIT